MLHGPVNSTDLRAVSAMEKPARMQEIERGPSANCPAADDRWRRAGDSSIEQPGSSLAPNRWCRRCVPAASPFCSASLRRLARASRASCAECSEKKDELQRKASW